MEELKKATRVQLHIMIHRARKSIDSSQLSPSAQTGITCYTFSAKQEQEEYVFQKTTRLTEKNNNKIKDLQKKEQGEEQMIKLYHMNKEFPQFSAWIKVMHCYIARKNTGQLVKA